MIWIPGNVPSSKNSKINTSKGSFHSKTVRKYLQFIGVQHYSVRRKLVRGYVTRENKFENLREDFERDLEGVTIPIKIGFHFVRNSKRKFDFHNIVQIIADLMVAHDFIEEDDMTQFLPFPLKKGGKYFSIDKENPGVWIKIFKN